MGNKRNANATVAITAKKNDIIYIKQYRRTNAKIILRLFKIVLCLF